MATTKLGKTHQSDRTQPHQSSADGRTETKRFVVRDGHGTDSLSSFCAATDTIAFDMVEMTTFKDVCARMAQTGDDVTITYDNGDRLMVRNVQIGDLRQANFQFSAGPVCVLEGTPICTQRGQIAIEDLRPDDILWTKDHGWQALRLVVFEMVHFCHRDDPGKPILIPAGALGHGQPATSLVTSPQQRILRTHGTDGQEELVSAIDLVGTKGIRQMRGRKTARYFNVVMERHSIIQAAGCWVESLLATSHSIPHYHASARRLLSSISRVQPARRIEQAEARPRRLKSA